MPQSNALISPSANTAFAGQTDFTALLEKEFKPKTEEQRSAVETAVRTLAQQAVDSAVTLSGDAYRTIQAIIAEIDRKMSEQIDRIIHHEDFQKLEAAWRGLYYLVSNTETDEMLKIRFINISSLRKPAGIYVFQNESQKLGGLDSQRQNLNRKGDYKRNSGARCFRSLRAPNACFPGKDGTSSSINFLMDSNSLPARSSFFLPSSFMPS